MSGMKKTEIESFDQMDPEERKYEARRRIIRMVVMRVILSALLLWVIFSNDLSIGMIVVLIAVIVVILASLIPVLAVFKTDLKYEDE